MALLPPEAGCQVKLMSEKLVFKLSAKAMEVSDKKCRDCGEMALI
jgi:hypothetical protein